MPRYRKTGGSLYEAANRFREYNGAFRRVLRSYRKVGSSLYQFFESGNVVTVTLPHSESQVLGNGMEWLQIGTSYAFPNLGSGLAAGADDIYLGRLVLRSTDGRISLQLAPTASMHPGFAGDEFSDQMEQNGSITFEASDGESVTVTGISDSTEPYNWIPSNAAALGVLVNHIRNDLTDRTLIVTFNDNP